MPRLLNVDQVAEIVGVSAASIRRLEKAGKLPEGIRLSWKTKRWAEPAITAWIESLHGKG